jgi:hypothetical protein
MIMEELKQTAKLDVLITQEDITHKATDGSLSPTRVFQK